MLKRIMNVFVLIPIAVVLIVLSVANRQVVTLALNPFRPSDSVLSVSAPFFVFLFLAFLSGVIIGSLTTWFKQAKHRKRARTEAGEAVKWHAEAEKQKVRAENIANHALLPAGQK